MMIFKRLLRRYGYLPDMQMLATETVIKQAEMISSELAKRKSFSSSVPSSFFCRFLLYNFFFL